MSEERNATKESVNTALYEHTFPVPFEWEGVTYEKLSFDFSRLSGADSMAVEDELQSKGIFIVSAEFNSHYLIALAARASNPKVGSDMLAKLPLKEFTKIKGYAKAFLLTAESV